MATNTTVRQKEMIMGGKYTKQTIQKTWCPRCGARPNQPCIDNAGRNHLERMKKVQDFMNPKIKQRSQKHGRTIRRH
jgi:hypothetical protein